jgi:hypothetical protein
MENIIKKLSQLTNRNAWDNWTVEEKQQLLNIYFIISKKESHIFDLIFTYHGCDSWEDIFRDYDVQYLKDKADGVKIAIREIEGIEEIKQSIKKSSD